MLGIIRAFSNSLRTRLFSAALLLPLLALEMATSGVGLRCRITGQVSSACCCDSGIAAKVDSVSTVSQADCCDRVVREVTSTLGEMSASTRLLPELAVPVAYAVFEASPGAFVSSGVSVLAIHSESRASMGPPSVRLRLVNKSAFLI